MFELILFFNATLLGKNDHRLMYFVQQGAMESSRL